MSPASAKPFRKDGFFVMRDRIFPGFTFSLNLLRFGRIGSTENPNKGH
jgi:hypothetical protein